MDVLQTMAYDMPVVFGAGLSGVTDWLISDWIRPVFIVVVAGVSLTFLFNRSFRALGVFALIAAVAGVFIFAGDTLFGSESATLTGAVNEGVGKVANVISPHAVIDTVTQR